MSWLALEASNTQGTSVLGVCQCKMVVEVSANWWWKNLCGNSLEPPARHTLPTTQVARDSTDNRWVPNWMVHQGSTKRQQVDVVLCSDDILCNNNKSCQTTHSSENYSTYVIFQISDYNPLKEPVFNSFVNQHFITGHAICTTQLLCKKYSEKIMINY